MRYFLRLLPQKKKDYLFYLPLRTYQWLNQKYDGKTLPIKLQAETLTDILNDKINKISIIITTKNRLEALQKYALASLERLQFETLPYEIIIVDNNSDDDTFPYLQDCCQKNKRLKIFQEKKLGVSAGRNYGISMASGELLMFMDDDCEIDQDWLTRAYQNHCQKNYFLGQGQIYDTVLKKLLLEEKNSQIDFFQSNMAAGNMSIRKKLFNYVSFNENISFFHEEKDLIGQIKTFWPGFPYFIDRFSIKHHRAPSIYRKTDLSYNKKSIDLSIKMYNLSYLSESTLKRNLNLESPLFNWQFFFKELFFLPLELIFFLHGDLIILLKTKIKLYRQLKYLQNLL